MRTMFPARVLVITLILLAVCPAWGDESVTWNVALQYEGDHLSILQADRIPPMLKDTMQFGVAASSPVVRYELDWLASASEVILSTTMEIGLGVHTQQEGGNGTNLVQEEGAVEFRAPGPHESDSPRKIRLRRLPGNYDPTLDLPLAFQWETIELFLPSGKNKDTIPAAIRGITKIRDTGDDANRIVVVIMSEGYTAQNLDDGLFSQQVEYFLRVWQTCSPWDEYWNLVNVYRMDVVSEEEGGDIPAQGIYADTYFDAIADIYWHVSDTKAIQATNYFFATGVADARLALVNSEHPTGMGASIVTTCYARGDWGDLAVRLFGFHFADLADENDIQIYRTIPPTNADNRPNWSPTYELAQLPWKVWVTDGVPLPTPETQEYENAIGAFEGAMDWPVDVYRPTQRCKMRVPSEPFCPICVEGHIMKFIQKVQLAVTLTPSNKEAVILGSQDQEFKVEPLDVPSLNYQWKLGTQVIEGAVGPSVSLSASDLQTDVGYLYLTITHTSPHIRKTPPYKRYTWVLNKETSAVKEWEAYTDQE